MTDNLKKTDPERIKQMVDNMIRGKKQEPSLLLNPNAPRNEQEAMWGAIQQVDLNTQQIAIQQHGIAQALDVARMTIRMLSEILIENEMITKEDLNERYQKDVVEKIQEAQAKAKEEYMAAMKEAEEPIEEPAAAEEDPVAEQLSDIVLPSEKEGSVITFPSRKGTEVR